MAGKTGAKTLYIEPGSPWENGYCESFNSKLRDEFLNGKIFYSIKERRVLAERWRLHDNTVRPHSSLGDIPPAPEAWLTPPRRRLLELRNSYVTLIRPTPQKIGHSSCEHSMTGISGTLIRAASRLVRLIC